MGGKGGLLRPLTLIEGMREGCTQRKVACRKDIGMPGIEQQMHLGRPAPDALDGDKTMNGGIRLHACKLVEIEPARDHGIGKPHQRIGLCCSQPEARSLPLQGMQAGFGGKRTGRIQQAGPDCIGTGAGHKLRHDHIGKSRKALKARSLRQRATAADQRDEGRIASRQIVQRLGKWRHHVPLSPGIQSMAEGSMPRTDRQQPVFRFAPSPNGRLHLGHALSAFLNHDMARATGGLFLIRIEDIDRSRCSPQFEAEMREDLAWLGLTPDRPPIRQSDHLQRYQDALQRLEAMGLVYPAFLTRGAVKSVTAQEEARTGTRWPRDPDGALIFPDLDRNRDPADRQQRLEQGEKHAIRLDMARALSRIDQPLFWQEAGEREDQRIAADPSRWGDVVLSRSDAPGSYTLCVVVDDAAQAITDVVRGLDLYEATAVQRLLQVLLGLPEPRYHHHRLILGADGRKLSKSEGSTALSTLRAEGASPSDIRRLVGLSPTP